MITAENKGSHILYTEGDYSRHAVAVLAKTESLDISDNHFIGHSLGVLLDKDSDEPNPELTEYSFIKVLNNNFTVSSKVITLRAKRINYCLIANNYTALGNDSMENLIEINSDVI